MKFLSRLFGLTRLFKPVACAVVVMMAASAAWGQGGEPFEASVSMSLDRYAVEGAWSQRHCVLVNSTDRARTIKIVCQGGSGAAPTDFTRIVSVPAHSIRRATLAVQVGSLTPSGRPFRSFVECDVVYSFEDESGQTIKRLTEKVMKAAPKTALICNVGNQPGGSGNTQYDTALSIALGACENVYAAPPSLWPDCWYGYGVADFIVVGQAELQDLRPSQVQALTDWVAQGHVMAIVASPAAQRLLEGPLMQAAGVTSVGHHEVRSLAVIAGLDGKAIAPPITLPAACMMMELCPETATVLYSANGLPLITRNAYGSGQVLTVATPLAALSAPSLRLMGELQIARNTAGAFDPSQFLAASREILNKNAGVPGPPRIYPTLLLAMMACGVVVCGVLLRFRGRSELVWLVLTPAALLIAIGMCIYGASRSSSERLSFIGLAVQPDQGPARVQEVFAYGSDNHEQTVSFAAGSPRGIIQNIASGGTVVRTGPAMTISDQVVGPESTWAFFIDDMQSLPGISGELTFTRRGLEGTLASRFDSEITGAVLYAGGQSYKVGTVGLSPVGVVIEPANRLGSGEFTTSLVASDRDMQRNALLGQLASRSSQARQASFKPLLVGYLDYSLLNPLDRPIKRQGWVAVAMEVPIVPPKAGSQIIVPSGFAQVLQREGAAGAWLTPRTLAGSSMRTVEIRGILPPQVKQLQDAQATVSMMVRARGIRLSISGVTGDAPAADVPLMTVDNPNGPVRVSVPKADAFCRADGYMFRLTFEPLKADENVSQWSVESVDIALEGISR